MPPRRIEVKITRHITEETSLGVMAEDDIEALQKARLLLNDNNKPGIWTLQKESYYYGNPKTLDE